MADDTEKRPGRFMSAVTALFGSRGSREDVEERAITSLPWNVGDPVMGIPGRVTQERALSLVPVYAANRILGDTISTLPLKAYRRIDNDTRQRMSNLPQLFRTMDDNGELTDWLHKCVTSLTLRGNAYGYIVDRDGFGFPTQIAWLRPTDIDVDDHDMLSPVWYWQGRRIDKFDLVHIPWFTVAGKVKGLSPLEAMQAACQTGLDAQAYAGGFYQAGGIPPGTFKNTQKTVEAEQAAVIKRRLTAAIRTRETIVYGSDWDYNAIQVPPEQAAFVETTRLTATQIAAIYGIPPDMIGGQMGDSLTYTTVEQNAIKFVTFTLRPWLVKIERALSAILPDRQYVKFDANALVSADLTSRVGLYHQALTDGWRSRNEVRALEDLEPISGGDKYMDPTKVPAPGSASPPPFPDRAGSGQGGDGGNNDGKSNNS